MWNVCASLDSHVADQFHHSSFISSCVFPMMNMFPLVLLNIVWSSRFNGTAFRSVVRVHKKIGLAAFQTLLHIVLHWNFYRGMIHPSRVHWCIACERVAIRLRPSTNLHLPILVELSFDHCWLFSSLSKASVLWALCFRQPYLSSVNTWCPLGLRKLDNRDGTRYLHMIVLENVCV